jgi:hypothetical protein
MQNCYWGGEEDDEVLFVQEDGGKLSCEHFKIPATE